MTPVRSSMAEVLLCLKRDSSNGMDSSPSDKSESQAKNAQATADDENSPDEVVCNCKKSKCLKLYCQCFASQIVCNPSLCKCTRCANTPSHTAEREEAVKLILERNPAAFDSKFKREASDDGTKTHKTGCRCRKSMCLKKYCECYHAGVPCSSICTCLQCANLGGKSSASLSVVSTPASGGTSAKRAALRRDSTPDTAGVMRAAQDLALLRNKEVLRASGAAAHAPKPTFSPSSTLSFSSSPRTTMSKPGGDTSLSGDHSTPPSDVEDPSCHLPLRKRLRADSPVNDRVGGERPPSILTRGGSSTGKQKSPPLTTGCSSGKAHARPLMHPNSHSQAQSSGPGEVAFCDLGMLAGGHFKRQAPPTLRISSASPNSLYCASALSLLSGRDISPQSLSSSPSGFSTKRHLSSAPFFASSPILSRQVPASTNCGDDDDVKKIKAVDSLSGMLEVSGAGIRRPHSSSVDNTSEEDATSTSDSPYARGLPPPSGTEVPPPLLLPPDTREDLVDTAPAPLLYPSSRAPPFSALSYSDTNNNHNSHFQHGVDMFNGDNWTKPVVDVMGKMS